MQTIGTLIKSWIFDKGAKVAAGAGVIAILLDVVERFSQNGEPARLCVELGQGGALLVLCGFLVLVAFKSDPPRRKNEYE
jgi:hypothetical protein